ncbi:MAG: YigZ family protein [Gemmatimonadetes bacterium]|nr:YigZ family protein [Gemmatimonadota bacterium]
MTRYPVPARRHTVEETIRRSRFITTLARAPEPAAAHAFVASVRDESPDATHHCWAFVAGPPGSTARIGMSDDGEPQGTAGRPMLTALLHGGVGEVVAVCTRYYGGVKLGTGGLGRAYSGGVVRALDSLTTEERVERVPYVVTVGYPDIDALQRLIAEMELPVLDEAFGAEVRYRLDVPVDEAAALVRRVTDLSRGAGVVEKGE